MTHSPAIRNVLFLAGAIMLPAALIAPSRAATTSRASTPAGAQAHDSAPDICLDQLYYGPLPGKTNYCLGRQDWNNGQYQNALALFKLAAGWGNKNAQYSLGLIYYSGHHVGTNHALGLAWLKLADERQNDPQIGRVTRSAMKWATPSERQQAERLYTKMLHTYGDEVAAKRAWRHLEHWKQRNGSGPATICLSGAQLNAVRQAGLPAMGAGMGSGLQARRGWDKAHNRISEPMHHFADTVIHRTTGRANVPGANNASAATPRGQACIGTASAAAKTLVWGSVATYFSGWWGTVAVGPLQQVPAPAASTAH